MNKLSLFIALLFTHGAIFASEVTIRNFGPPLIKISVFSDPVKNDKAFMGDVEGYGPGKSFNVNKPLTSASYRDTANNKQYRIDFPPGRRVTEIIIGSDGRYSLKFSRGDDLGGQQAQEVK